MVRALEVEIISRETIKPSSPTPHNLRNFRLSLLDQIMPVEYTAAILFYTTNGEPGHNFTAAQISQRLKKSLSETLTSYYPFSGVIKDHFSVECNDNGAEFLEARASCVLADILEKPDQMLVRDFLPIKIESPQAGSGPLLLVQVTFFKCGGVSVGTCISHKIADGCTATIFVKNWSSIALDSGKTVLNVPKYNVASLFPPDDSLASYMDVTGANYITKRFVFNAAKIAELRAKLASANVSKPTRVEAIIALIWKCTITASRSIRGFPRLSFTVHSMDLRRMVSPSLPENIMGNFVGDFPAQTSEKWIELQDLIYQLRKGKEEFKINGLRTILENRSLGVNRIGDDVDFYMYSDVSKLPQYEIDFGWGKPVWSTLPNYMHNMVMLLSTRDGAGIEALVSLKEEDMALFERDKELLSFATSNPSVLPTENELAECLLNSKPYVV